MLSTAQLFVNPHGCAFAVTNTVNNQSRSEDAIAACKDARSRGHQSLRIHCDQSARRNLDLVFGSKEVKPRRLADGHDDGVALDLALAVFVERRIEAAVLIKDPLRRQRFECNDLAIIADDPLRPEARMNNDSLFLGFFDLFERSWHLVPSLQAN